jgi:hypothetical protein
MSFVLALAGLFRQFQKEHSPKFGFKSLHRSPARCAKLPSKRRRVASAGCAARPDVRSRVSAGCSTV